MTVQGFPWTHLRIINKRQKKCKWVVGTAQRERCARATLSRCRQFRPLLIVRRRNRERRRSEPGPRKTPEQVLAFPRGTLLCHTSSHGKQRQRQERNQESPEAEAKTGARPQARRVYARSAQIGRSSERPATWYKRKKTLPRGRVFFAFQARVRTATQPLRCPWNGPYRGCS